MKIYSLSVHIMSAAMRESKQRWCLSRGAALFDVWRLTEKGFMCFLRIATGSSSSKNNRKEKFSKFETKILKTKSDTHI